MRQPDLLLQALAKDALQIGDRIGGMGERIGPLLLDMRLDDFPDNRVSQIVLSLEVMKERALSHAGAVHDAIETATLKSVFIKLFKSGFQDFPSRVSRGFFGGHSHSVIHNTDQSVCSVKCIFFL